LLFIITIVICTLSVASSEDYLPRISLKEKDNKIVFCKEGEQVFVPRGFNHIVLEHGSSGWHALFNTNVYNPYEIEKTLKEMSRCGANVVRVWAWGVQNEFGVFGRDENNAINSDYINNFIDFLRKANKYKIYVIPILDEFPKYGYFGDLAKELHSKFPENDITQATGYNRQFFWESYIRAKAEGIKRFVNEITKVDINLLNVILGWSLQNEVFVKVTEGPFADFDSTIKLRNGGELSNKTPEDRQKIYDTAILYWANELTKAIKEEDPSALVTVGMWTSDSAGRIPCSGLPHDGKDPRIPPRPSVLGGETSLIDFIDIHIYPWDGTSKVNPACHEHRLVKKPVIVGEYGVFPPVPIERAKEMMIEMLSQAYQLGYIGDLHWAWDLRNIPGQTYSAVSDGLCEYLMNWKGWRPYFQGVK